MSQVLKAVLNPVTNGIIFIYEDKEVAFCYNSFIFKNRKESALQQFIEEFAAGGDGNAEHMSEDVASYCDCPLGTYDDETLHEAAVVVYTIENGFGIQ
ncbi:hypothetical protein Kassivere_00051 [Pseudomonas phage vB_PpuM-Kassivere]